MFLKRNPQVKSYVILDDRKDAAEDELLEHFVKTDPSVGISDEDVKRAVGLLN
jgi:hypothetical protein